MPFSVHEYLAVKKSRRDLRWLRRALRAAAELEFFTIPPYLTAMWSIVDPYDLVVDQIRWIVREEMGHMGQVCNLLTSLGFTPRINHRARVPIYPSLMPGNVNPHCLVSLEPISKCLVRRVFMEIEKPDFPPVAAMGRQKVYETIGAFYDSIREALISLNPDFGKGRQIEHDAHGVTIKAIGTLPQALDEIDRIKGEGEGTPSNPVGPNGLAHYYRFGEIAFERRFVNTAGNWEYSGPAIPFPAAAGVHRMAVVPPKGYPKVAMKFDRLFSQMLDYLQFAWTAINDADSKHALERSIAIMNFDLPQAARELMTTPIPGSDSLYYGPTFKYRP